MVAQSSAASTMAALVAEKFDLRLDRDRELIRQLSACYMVEGYQTPPPPLWRMNQCMAGVM
jgi:hypothetical protein